jgi:ribosome-binding protein aMBF1 (putative translation factor)
MDKRADLTYRLWPVPAFPEDTAAMGEALLQRLGEKVRVLRRAGDLTQEQLADRSGLHPTYIAGIESGRRNPSLRSLQALATGLGISLSSLLEGVDESA